MVRRRVFLRLCAVPQLWAAVCALVLLGACAGKGVKPDTAFKAAPAAGGQSPFVFKKRGERAAMAPASDGLPRASKGGGGSGAGAGVFDSRRSDAGWSILVMTFRGAGAEVAAQQAVAQFTAQTGLSGARAEPREGGDNAWALLQGSYPDSGDPRAKSDLAVVRQIAPGAILVPPASTAAGSLPDFDLSTLHARAGKSAKWTLQVAYYGHADRATPTDKELEQFRAAAEKAVVELRAAGEEAFYYHSPRGSSVTVGVFDDGDQVNAVKDPITGKVTQLPRTRESLRLTEARRAHPLNLVNGAPILVKSKGSSVSREQESFLVRVPGS